MPTYEFACPAGHQFDRFFRRIADAPSELECPECGVVASRRISGGAGLLFKGSGFYITDYGKDGKKEQRAKADTSDKKSESAATESGAKPAESTAPTKPSSPEKKTGSTE